jgi:hypothetical protein
MLRLRRREMVVSSTLLWQRLLRDREANAPWQRLRRNLLLFLQLLILTGLVIALARPYLPVPAVVSGSVVVLLDGSASMLATDVAPTRFEVARKEVERIIGRLSGGDQMTLILVGRTPQTLVAASADREALRGALSEAAARPLVADWEAAFALAAGAAQGFEEARIAVVSDGGLPARLPLLPAEIVYVPVGASGANLAISALATRPAANGIQAFAAVTNYGPEARQALISISLDGRLHDSRRLEIGALETETLTWELDGEVGLIEAGLSEHEPEYLREDDAAAAVHQGGATRRILLVTAGNRFLETALTLLPGVEAFKVAPDRLPEELEQFDLLVYDSVPLPRSTPNTNLLVVNPLPTVAEPAAAEPLLTITGSFTNTAVIEVADEPLLANVLWSDVHVREATAVTAPWAETLVAAEGGPLLLAGERAGRRIAILPFRLQDSDLPLQIAFPVLVANITGWLSPGQAFDGPTSLVPGDSLVIRPPAGVEAITVLGPGGTTWVEEVGAEPAVFGDTNVLGAYQVLFRERGVDRPAGGFAVNLIATSESNINPAPSIRVGQTEVRTAGESNVGQQELWPWLGVAALLLLIVEWWVYHQGPRLPRRSGLAGARAWAARLRHRMSPG